MLSIMPHIADPADAFFKSLVKDDLHRSILESHLSLDRDLYEALLVQSVLGHAQNGHKGFRIAGVRYPSATITDIIEAADLDVIKIKTTRQRLIDEVFSWASRARAGFGTYLHVESHPLLGLQFFQQIEVDPFFVLKGLVLAGCMDNYQWRMKTMEHYPKTIDGTLFTLGGGETYLIEREALQEQVRENPFFLDDLSKEEHGAQEIARWSDSLFASQGTPSSEVVYARRKEGLGTSDDAAALFGGVLSQPYGEKEALSTLLGVIIGDGLDTYDKCVLHPIPGGYDELLATEIRSELPEIVSDEDILHLIYFAAKGNGNSLVSSSHKRFIQLVEVADPKQTTVEHHLKFLQQGNYAPFRIGFERMLSPAFYEEVRRRMEYYHNHGEE